jgi:hypothetical protein
MLVVDVHPSDGAELKTSKISLEGHCQMVRSRQPMGVLIPVV